MILENEKIIFVHIIKTAGVSIEKYFGAGSHDHRNVIDYIELLGGKEEFEDYFSFTIVRNPWDKMVSQYFFNAHKWVPENTTFKQYIELFGAGRQISRFTPLHLPYIVDDEDNILVDYIGKFEALDDSMNHVCQKIGTSYHGMPHLNRSKRGDYRKYYDEESVEIVRKMFKKEIEMFDYKFGA